VVDQLIERHDAQVEWLPFLLRPDMPETGEELPAAIRAKAQVVGGRLKQMAQAYGLPMMMSTQTPNSRLAHEATEYAREQGRGEVFHRIVFRKYYGEGQNIGDWDVLRAAATEAGLDPDALQQVVQSRAYRSVVEEQMAEAYALGIHSVPTYIVNDRYAVVGAQPYPVFEQVIDRLKQERDEEARP
jgi:predicted DsbA family dithiol-disulfide isomerase